jgi:antitoxin (DNA-binding transcriptional repressor) of toxin-antitoxin stability system
MIVNVHEAKTHLSPPGKVSAGEEVVVARSGTPVARLCPPTSPEKESGSSAGTVGSSCRKTSMIRCRWSAGLVRALTDDLHCGRKASGVPREVRHGSETAGPMNSTVTETLSELASLARRYHLAEIYVFGSRAAEVAARVS